ncbi:Uncharacterised protein [uncultured archaeon]|nr:Uncharacterised protein [uncultured archaeon]
MGEREKYFVQNAGRKEDCQRHNYFWVNLLDYAPSGLFEVKFYFEANKCGSCERFDAILLGRTIKETSENGTKFRFLFEWRPYVNIKVDGKWQQLEARTIEEWKKVIGTATIYDSYDRRYTWDQFMAQVVEPLQKETANPGFYGNKGYDFNSDGTFGDFAYERYIKWLNEHPHKEPT